MKLLRHLVPCVFVLVALAGCASTKVTAIQSDATGERIARPDHIIVYDFAATPADISAESSSAGQYAAPSTPQTAEEIETGRKLAALVAEKLVADIQAMGLPAERAADGAMPQAGDIVIKGYFASVDEGSVGKRLVVGFGSGAASLKTVVEGYLMTEQGLRRLGSGEVDSSGGKSPGMLVPLAVVAATANPIGLLVGGAVKLTGEATGSATVEGAAERTAKEIAEQLQERFQKQGWI